MPRNADPPGVDRAWPAIGVRQEPSRTARKARSAASAAPVSASTIRPSAACVAASSVRSRQPDRALADGRQKIVDIEQGGRAMRQPKPLQPGIGQTASRRLRPARPCAAGSPHCRAAAPTSMSGRSRLTCARRRSEAVPSVAPRGSAASLSGPRGNKRVADVLARQIAGDRRRPRAGHGRQILRGMDGDVDLAVEHRGVDFLGEKPLCRPPPRARDPGSCRRVVRMTTISKRSSRNHARGPAARALRPPERGRAATRGSRSSRKWSSCPFSSEDGRPRAPSSSATPARRSSYGVPAARS